MVTELSNQPLRLNVRVQEIERCPYLRRVDVSLLAFQNCGFEDRESFQNGHSRLEVAQ
jgi:hypothetical protein